ncbi:MAG: cation diffusion facilitator family transporter [Promethearchaeota archaeon]
MDHNLQRKLEKRASIYSVILVVVASAVKTIMIFFTNSVSFRGEFTDSIIDIVIVGLTFMSLKISRKPADTDHMYGHNKVNSFMGIMESFLIMGLYGYILYTAIVALVNYDEYVVENPLITVYSLLGIIALNIFVTTQVVRIGKKLNNSVIKAQGVNFRGDLFRNIAVIGALIGAFFNIHIIDPILAILAVGYAYYESIKIIRVSFNELIDYNAVDPDRIEKIKRFIMSIPEISIVDYFAVRTAGRKLELAVRIVVKSKDDLADTHEIVHTIKKEVEKEFSDYEINSFIEIMHGDDFTPMDSNIFEKIRRIVKEYKILQDVHHLSIDRLEKMLLIQFHVNVNKNKSLNEIHDIVTKMEDNMKYLLSEDLPELPIEILSHIEPTDKVDFSMKSIDSKDNSAVDKKMREIIETIPEIADYKIVNLLEEFDGYFLSIIIYLDEELSLSEAHLIAELLEINLKQSIQELHNCIIHTEPIKRK